MTVNTTQPAASAVRSLVRNESSYRTLSRETAGDASDFSRVLHGESVRLPTEPAAAAARTTSPAISDAQQPLHYNVQGLVTANGEASIPPLNIPAPAAIATAVEPPSAESVFGANPWMASPTGYSSALGSYGYNPLYFATRDTADKVAQLLGGTVVEKNSMVGDAGPFFQSQANYMVQLPNGHLVNAGLTASYYTHGWSQSQIDRMLQCDRNV